MTTNEIEVARMRFEDSVRLFPGSDVPIFGHAELEVLLDAVRAHERAVIMESLPRLSWIATLRRVAAWFRAWPHPTSVLATARDLEAAATLIEIGAPCLGLTNAPPVPPDDALCSVCLDRARRCEGTHQAPPDQRVVDAGGAPLQRGSKR